MGSGSYDWDSSAFAAIKAKQETNGEQDKHPKLKWSEYASKGNPQREVPIKESHGQVAHLWGCQEECT
jgi:hypothetical protein